MHFSDSITIKGREFKLIKVRQYKDIGVYRHKTQFLRLGSKRDIEQELSKHNSLALHNFPLPKILAKGKYKNLRYYIENSLGAKHFGEIFAEETKKNGKISDQTFNKFLKVALQYARAQLQTEKPRGSFSAFGKSVHLDLMAKELPEQKNRILKKFAEAKGKLKIYPFVLTHGDFNPHNSYSKGVIDFEHLHYAPAGYDLVTNIFTISYFPTENAYEFKAHYNFSKKQIKKYLQTLDALYQSRRLPKISSNYEYFAFCRALWLSARMQKFPKIQQYRYKLFEKLLRS